MVCTCMPLPVTNWQVSSSASSSRIYKCITYIYIYIYIYPRTITSPLPIIFPIFSSSQLFSIVAQVVYFTCQIFLSFFPWLTCKNKMVKPPSWEKRRRNELQWENSTLNEQGEKEKGLSRQWPLVMTMIRKFLQLTHPYFSLVLVHNIFFSFLISS